jgi:hypothetical protein
MTAENKNLLYRYEGTSDSATVSVYPSSRLLSDALQIDLPEIPRNEKVLSVRSSGNSAYRWLKPTGRYFSEIFITVSAVAKEAVKRTLRFFRGAVAALKMSLTLRKTVCLRL